MMSLRTQKTCKDFQKPQRINNRVLLEIGKRRTEQQQLPAKQAKETLSSKEEQLLKQVNKYKLTTKFRGGNTKLFAKTGKINIMYTFFRYCYKWAKTGFQRNS